MVCISALSMNLNFDSKLYTLGLMCPLLFLFVSVLVKASLDLL